MFVLSVCLPAGSSALLPSIWKLHAMCRAAEQEMLQPVVGSEALRRIWMLRLRQTDRHTDSCHLHPALPVLETQCRIWPLKEDG
ncbi:hypothetical protein CI102_425 [Trichoderma harzianum]|nr:hypothetical protein CI102_425 [Trichoderma harzianum]